MINNKYINESDKEAAKLYAEIGGSYNAFLIVREITNRQKEEEAISFGNFLNHNPAAAKAFIDGKTMEEVYELFKNQEK
jgi:hypothetical protein